MIAEPALDAPSGCSPTCRPRRRCGARACASATGGRPRSTACPSPSAAARWWACSGRTAPARPASSRSCSASCAPDAGEVLLLGRPARDPARGPASATCRSSSATSRGSPPPRCWRLHVRLAGRRRAGRGAARVPGRRRPRRPRRRPRGRLLQGHAAAPRAGRRAAWPGPELVVLDEPTSALDPLGRADVRDLLLSLSERGVAVLLNSHLIGEVERVCDRVVILDKGRVAASGTLAELLGRRELRLRLDGRGPADAEARLAAAGPLTRNGDWFTVALPADEDAATVPDLVADLVALGVRVHAVEPGRISLEERLLDILRAGSTSRVTAMTAPDRPHLRRPHAPGGRAPARAARARRADDRAAGAQRLGVLPASRRSSARRSPAARRGWRPPRCSTS